MCNFHIYIYILLIASNRILQNIIFGLGAVLAAHLVHFHSNKSQHMLQFSNLILRIKKTHSIQFNLLQLHRWHFDCYRRKIATIGHFEFDCVSWKFFCFCKMKIGNLPFASDFLLLRISLAVSLSWTNYVMKQNKMKQNEKERRKVIISAFEIMSASQTFCFMNLLKANGSWAKWMKVHCVWIWTQMNFIWNCFFPFIFFPSLPLALRVSHLFFHNFIFSSQLQLYICYPFEIKVKKRARNLFDAWFIQFVWKTLTIAKFPTGWQWIRDESFDRSKGYMPLPLSFTPFSVWERKFENVCECVESWNGKSELSKRRRRQETFLFGGVNLCARELPHFTAH